jgi:pyruvate kinase
MQKRTKIVATIGPATETETVIAELIKAGMNVARFNTKHGTPDWHLERIKRVKSVAKEMNVAVGILLDLQGPEIRINLPEQKAFEVVEGEEVLFANEALSAAELPKSDKMALIPANVIETLQEGHLILLDDGLCEFEVVGKRDGALVLKALGNFPVKHRKTMNIPGVIVDMPSLIPADLVQLDNMTDADIDFVGLSFVRDKKDIAILRSELAKRNLHADIIAKIENQAALDNLDEIVAASDAVMVARGDLAVEVPFEQLTYWQKMIIAKSRLAGKPVITATQMLKSMVDQPRPTRAEVSDVAHAVYDSTSAVMLSEETTIGKYPVKAVATQAKIASYNEQFIETQLGEWIDDDNLASITHSAVDMLAHSQQKINKVICLTTSGRTAQLIARFCPALTVQAVTSSPQVYSKLSLVYGVEPHLMDGNKISIEHTADLLSYFKEKNLVEVGQTVLLVYGSVFKATGFANSLSLLKIE